MRALLLALVLAMPLIVIVGFGWYSRRAAVQNLPAGVQVSPDIVANGSGSTDGLPKVDWKQLRELDVDTGVVPESLKAFNGKMVKIPGFMVPLEDAQREITEFLLVPNPQACIHVPAPPPNQIVLVRMAGGNTAKVGFEPIWATGYLRISTVSHAYGKASFVLEAQRTEIYRDGG